jgi:urease accessory protein
MNQISKHTARCLVSLIPLVLAVPAHAHHAMGGNTPQTAFQGFLSGLAHPLIGIDHFAFLAVVALLSLALSGASRHLVPAAFVAATLVGTLIHLGALELPWTETLIALSVLGGGALVLSRAHAPAALLAILFAGFGIFHGYAYGESIVGAETGPISAYLVGFALVQYGVIAIGVQLLSLLGSRYGSRAQMLATRGVGFTAAVTGTLFLSANLV